MIQGDNLADDGHVFARENGKLDPGELNVEDRNPLIVQAGPGIVLIGPPLHELNDQLYPLLKPDCANTEHAPDIDEPETPDLHKMLDQIGSRPHQNALSLPRNHHNIVRDQSVPAFDEVEGNLAFPDSRAANQENTDAVHIDEGSVHHGLGGKLIVQEIGQEIDEFRRLEGGPEDGRIARVGELQECLVDLIVARRHYTGHIKTENRFKRLRPLGGIQLFEVADFRIPERLHAIVSEKLDEAGQREPGAMDVLIGDFLVEAHISGERGKPQPFLVRFDQEPDRNARLSRLFGGLQHHSSSPSGGDMLSSFTRRSFILFFIRSFVLCFESRRSSFATARSIDFLKSSDLSFAVSTLPSICKLISAHITLFTVCSKLRMISPRAVRSQNLSSFRIDSRA